VTPTPYVSRGGLKLRHALDTLALSPAGLTCADLGCSTGGFTDCLLKAGAARVYAVDTAYGQLAWTLRNDPRVVVIERSNALHTSPPELVDLVVIDLGWTPQRLAIPAALAWLRPGPDARIISLIKPHYEASARGGGAMPASPAPTSRPPRGRRPASRDRGILPEEEAQTITDRVIAGLPALGVRVLGLTRSPILGGAGGKSKPATTGNAEWLVLLERDANRATATPP
jgi:23S rRNA (cytidine1920-2'-O)/16S rRNA (cytidine1409-2'-O)-methyltransferase